MQMGDFLRLCGVAQGEKGFPVALILLSSPPFLKDPDHLQDLVGKQRSPGVHTSGGESPAPRLPDRVLGHEVHALGRLGTHRFLRHGA